MRNPYRWWLVGVAILAVVDLVIAWNAYYWYAVITGHWPSWLR